MQAKWSVYLVRCRDGELYTGIATDVARRLGEHQVAQGKGAKYLRGRGPLRLVLERVIGRRGLALIVERRIKQLTKARKEQLVVEADVFETLLADAQRNSSRCDRESLESLEPLAGAEVTGVTGAGKQ